MEFLLRLQRYAADELRLGIDLPPFNTSASSSMFLEVISRKEIIEFVRFRAISDERCFNDIDTPLRLWVEGQSS